MTGKRYARSAEPNSRYAASTSGRGTHAVREPATVSSVFLAVFLFACRKYMFFSTDRRAIAYLLLLVASVAGDFVRFPKTYFADSGTFVNRYLVKLGWFWTTVWTLSFVVATGRVFRYAGGGRATELRHVARLAVATFFWYFWTGAFNRIGDRYGRCSGGGGAWTTRSSCQAAGFAWKSFDVSGHVFILVYSTLVMISEARPFVGWDRIQDALRGEENARRDGKGGAATSAFGGLGDDELRELKAVYGRVTPYVRALFAAITVFVVVWELMLVTTMMYFHSMPEKLLAGVLAVSTWFVTYKIWYPSPYSPPLPGDGFFKYRALQKSDVGAGRSS